MTFLAFLIVVLAGLFFLLFLPGYLQKMAGIYYFIWAVLGLSGIWTINTYLFPTDQERIFANVDYHVLEHHGFSFHDTLQLVNHTNPARSLWDSKHGNVSLYSGHPNLVRLRDFAEPLFLHDPDPEKDEFKLQNVPLTLHINDRLEFQLDGKPLISLTMTDGEEDTVWYKVRFGASQVEQTCRFHEKLKVGYPLADILRSAPGSNQQNEFIDLLEDSYLIRQAHGRHVEDEPLLFFPGPKFPTVDSIGIGNGNAILKASKIERDWDVQVPDGRAFFVGIGMNKMPSFKIKPYEDWKILEYTFYPRFYLQGEEVNNLFICSAYDDVTDNSSDAGYFFDLFEEEENIFHVNGHLLYEKGSSREGLSVRYINSLADANLEDQIRSDTIRAGQNFALSTKDDASFLQWVFKINDQRASSPLQPIKLHGFVILFVILVLITLWLKGGKELQTPEMMVYIALFAFLVIRIVLQWRVSAFLPVEDVSPREYASLASGRHFLWTTVFTTVFFVARWCIIPFAPGRAYGAPGSRISDWGDRIKGRFENLDRGLEKRFSSFYPVLADSLHPLGFMIQYILLLAALIGFFLLIGSLPIFDPERFVNIAAPVSVFLFMEIIIYSSQQSNGFHTISKLPFNNLLNGLATLAFLSARDAGFAIIFLLFLLLYHLTRSLFQMEKKRNRNAVKFLKAYLLPVGLGLAFLAILTLGNHWIMLILDQPVQYYYFGFFPLALLTIGLFAWHLWKASPKLDGKEPWKKNMFVGAFVVPFLVLFFLLGKYVEEHKDHFNYVKYRAAVQTLDIEDIIKHEAFDSPEMRRILQAGQNQWYINAYLHSSLKEEARSGGFFELKPHFKKGASFHAQTTDIVIPRFVISEHSNWVVLLLIAFFFMVAIGFANHREEKSKRFGETYVFPLLLGTTSFFIWLTSTNRFVFFGQDFPLISLTSKFTLAISLFILLLGIAFLARKRQGYHRKNQGNAFVMLVPTLLVAILAFVLPEGNTNQKGEGLNSFSISLRDAKPRFSALNNQLLYCQESLRQNGTDPGKDLIALMDSFYYSYLDDTIVSPDNNFVQSIFEDFVHSKGDLMDPNRILHLVNNREGNFEFALNHQYYLVPPPLHQQNRWRGNLLAAKVEAGVKLVDMEQRERFVLVSSKEVDPQFREQVAGTDLMTQMVSVPGSWILSGRPAVIVWDYAQEQNKANFNINNNVYTTLEYNQDFEHPALRLMPNDIITFKGGHNKREQQYKYVESFDNYLSKSIWLNGKPRMFYPMGERMFWAYNYSSLIHTAYSNSKDQYQDVRVSIDYDLNKSVDRMLEQRFEDLTLNESQRFSVAALNGDGQIRLIADYRPGKRANPNDIEDLNDYRNEMYKFKRTVTERALMGNANLLDMRAGPGSTMKPIVYSAVTSQYNLGWRSLNFLGANSAEVYEGDKMVMYGGKEVNLKWALDPHEFSSVDPIGYLSRSINNYHGLVMFLGSYSSKQLNYYRTSYAVDPEKAVFRPYSSGREYYPGFQLNGTAYSFNPDNWPRDPNNEGRLFGNTSSLLADGLLANYDFPTARSRNSTGTLMTPVDPSKHRGLYDQLKGGNFKYWSYPERSHFFQERRIPRYPKDYLMGIQQSVVHGLAVVEVTPVKMAEMMTRLYMQDTTLKMTLNDQVSDRQVISFEIDANSWGGEGGYASFLREVVFEGMHRVPLTGTARKMKSKFDAASVDHPEIKQFNYYAKTGTTSKGIINGRKDVNDRLLALVISKYDVRENLKAKGLRNKVYVLYFTGTHFGNVSSNDFYNLVTDIVVETLNSHLFKKYMEVE